MVTVKLYRVKHVDCDLWIAERRGGAARWSNEDEAMLQTKEYWEWELNPEVRHLFVLEEVSDG
jgi:hypothetical protein